MSKNKSNIDLHNNYTEISTLCHESEKPVFITNIRKIDSVIMSVKTYKQLTNRQDLYRLLQEGMSDLGSG